MKKLFYNLMSELFHWSYYYMKRLKTDNDPLNRAYFLMVWLHTFNYMTIFFSIDYFLKNKFNISIIDLNLNKKNIASWLVIIAIASPIYILNYRFVYNKQRRKAIEKNYSALSPKRQAKGKLLFWLYLIFSVVVCICLVNYYGNKNKIKNVKHVDVKESTWQAPAQQQSLDSFPTVKPIEEE